MLYEETDALSHWHLSNRVPRRKSMETRGETGRKRSLGVSSLASHTKAGHWIRTDTI